MRIIVVYDVGVNRVNTIRQILKQNLSWIQNSVFEGDLTAASLKELELKLKDSIDPICDSIIIYKINNPSWIFKKVIGKEKGNDSNVL